MALEEVQDNDGAEPESRDTTDTDATLTYEAFIAAIQAELYALAVIGMAKLSESI